MKLLKRILMQIKYRYKFKLLFLTILFSRYIGNAQDQDRNILRSAITEGSLKQVLEQQANFKPLPLPADPFWATLDPESRQELISRGEKHLGYEWPSLLARRYMDFDIDGNRTRYSDKYFSRRYIVADLCMAEIVENEGRFMDDIINGIWLIMEESTWVIPAHSEGDMLHDINDDFVDLFSAETAALLSWVDYFLGEKLDAYTALIRERIYTEVNRRVIQNMLVSKDFWYMGYGNSTPNNWNPWIVSNWLTAVLLLEKNQETRVKSVWKALEVLDNYINPFPADGGCDEGPSYWGRAGASLYDCLYLLHTATQSALDVYDNEIIQNIGSYIQKIHIDENWYVNFADGSANLNHDPGTLYRIGKAIDSQPMMAMAADQYRKKTVRERTPAIRADFGLRIVPGIMMNLEMLNYTGSLQMETEYYFPDLEVAIARQDAKRNGFFYAIKGGTNNESHNHNDVGSFVVFYDGKPLFIDAGVETYTAKTFSAERYSIWTMQSAFHNLPTLNGEMQAAGSQFRASVFDFEQDGRRSTARLEISGAYPEAAYTGLWERSMELDRKSEMIILTDSWDQEKQLTPNKWHFLLAYEPQIDGKGNIILSNGDSLFDMKFGRHFFPKIEKIDISDPRLRNAWGNSIWRLTLTSGKKGLHGSESFRVKKK